MAYEDKIAFQSVTEIYAAIVNGDLFVGLIENEVTNAAALLIHPQFQVAVPDPEEVIVPVYEFSGGCLRQYSITGVEKLGNPVTYEAMGSLMW